MNFNELKGALSSLATALDSSEKFFAGALAQRAKTAALKDPTDSSVCTAAKVLGDWAQKKPLITRAELNKIYDSLYSNGTELGEIFKQELKRPELPEPTRAKHAEEEVYLTQANANTGDPLLVNALQSLLDNETPRFYSKDMEKQAQRACLNKLSKIAVYPKDISVFIGSPDCIICSAAFETPKGVAHALVPVQFKESMAIPPNMFFSPVGFVDLDKRAIDNHVRATGGKSYKVDGKHLLKVIATASSPLQKPLNKVALAAYQMKTQQGQQTMSGDLVYASIDEPVQEITPAFDLNQEELTFQERLNTPIGIAQHLHGKQIVEAAYNSVLNKLALYKYSNPQISLQNVKEDSLEFAVSLDGNQGVLVPVKVSNGLVVPPKIAIASGKIAAFTPGGLRQLTAGKTDGRVMAKASAAYGSKPQEVFGLFEKALLENKISVAEELINVLSTQDIGLYRQAVKKIGKHFSGELVKEASEESITKCSFVMNHAHSTESLCGHLNLPLTKVYQDDNGDCRPLYRKGMKDATDPVAFINYRMYL